SFRNNRSFSRSNCCNRVVLNGGYFRVSALHDHVFHAGVSRRDSEFHFLALAYLKLQGIHRRSNLFYSSCDLANQETNRSLLLRISFRGYVNTNLPCFLEVYAAFGTNRCNLSVAGSVS